MFKRKWLGLNFILLGIIVAFTLLLWLLNETELQGAAQAFARVQGLWPLSGAQLRDMPPGALVAIEGRISADAPTLYDSLVAYVQREGSSVYGYRRTTDVQTPLLRIALVDGVVPISGVYEIHNPLTTVQSSSAGNRGAFGFKADQSVMVLGVVTRAGESVGLDAEVVSGASLRGYVAEKFVAASWPLWFGLLAGVLIVLGTWTVGRIVQRGDWTASHWPLANDDLPDGAADSAEWDWTEADDNEVEDNEARGDQTAG